MFKFIIRGGKKLSGEVEISGAKNASLGLLPATILADGEYTFYNSPELLDAYSMIKLLTNMGEEIEFKDHTIKVKNNGLKILEAPYEYVKKMRASIYVLGPMLARYGYAKVSMPGGCAWGPRPINLHIEAIQKLGANVEIDQGYIIAKAEKLQGTKIIFNIPSVGATVNTMLASVFAKGTTLISNAAIEPEVTAVGEFLVKMGAKISGIGSKFLEIEGVDQLHPADETIIPDRIEAGTLLVAGAITKGEIRIKKCRPDHLDAILVKLNDAGFEVSTGDDFVELKSGDKILPVNVETEVYPGFPTDMQAQWISLMSIAEGASEVTDNIYHDRFNHVPELNRLGADITVKGNTAFVKGVQKLKGAKVMSTDLRASASLVLAGLVAEGTTEVLRIYHLDRGYEKIENKLKALGADIERVQTDEY
ncbi:MAG: UDP-N-acetylglucosamine 1-carboxyvinyltransferase [Ignavibacteria bacterium]|jgi:UDP-N-acetylglucosamine 1-carboxyvinyltransferase|nr:UDP-N-acetylglucosamine 1-carboxyvinyltransferase [Ignavibacteria bacterium]MDH7527589.1 UDP-N-acetylglucosamine 1-carboxyvinyltransferase [Ignavibacteria bacterium]